MRHWFSALSLNQKMALGALVLGALAIFAVPYPGSLVTLDAKDLAVLVARQADRVEPPELASWIIETRSDYRLIDLRSDTEFAAYHIPTAANVPMAVLTDASLGRHEKLVLYSNDGNPAAQAWVLLKAKGYKGVYILDGGLEAWKDQVVFPIIADKPSPEQWLRDERARSISAYFGGQPRNAAAVATAGRAFAMPTIAAQPNVAPPVTPAGKAKPGVKKREGC